MGSWNEIKQILYDTAIELEKESRKIYDAEIDKQDTLSTALKARHRAERAELEDTLIREHEVMRERVKALRKEANLLLAPDHRLLPSRNYD